MPRLVFKHKSRYLIIDWNYIYYYLFGKPVKIWKIFWNHLCVLQQYGKQKWDNAPVWMTFNNMPLNALYNIDKKSSNT